MSAEREGLRERVEVLEAILDRPISGRWTVADVDALVGSIRMAWVRVKRAFRESGEPVAKVSLGGLDRLRRGEATVCHPPKDPRVSHGWPDLYASPPAPVEPEPDARYVVVCRTASGHEVIASASVHIGYEKAKGIRDALQRDAPSGTRYTVLPVGRARSEEGDDA